MARQLVFSIYQLGLYERAAALGRRRRWPGSPARRSRRSPTTAITPCSGWSGSATGPRRATAACRPGLDTVWPYVDELFEGDDVEPAWPQQGIGGRSGRPARRVVGVGRRRARRGDARAADAAVAGARRPSRRAQRVARLPAGRDAAPAPLAPGGVVVTATTPQSDQRAEARAVGGRRARPGGAGAHDRRPRRAPRRRGRPGRHGAW